MRPTLLIPVLLGAVTLSAQQNPPATPPPAAPASATADALKGTPRPARNPQEFEELQILHRFLSLPPERLAEIRQTIEKIEKLSPEERAALRAKVDQLRKEMPQDEFTTRLGPDWHKLGGKEKFMIMSALRFMKEEERREFMTRYQAADEAGKKAMLEEVMAKAKDRFRDSGEGFRRRDRDKEGGPPGPPEGRPGEDGQRPPRPDRPQRPHGGETPPPPPPAKAG